MIMMFILGVLFGWLLEALFVKFVLGKPLSIFTSKSAESSHAEDAEAISEAVEVAASDAETSADTQALAQCEKEKAALSQEMSALQESMTAEKAAHENTQGALTTTQAELDACNKQGSESVVDAVSGNAKEGDDLTKLGGIGPKIASLMKAAGIGNFAKIADTDVDTLCEELTKNGIPYSKANVATWAEQARYAQQSDWQGLKSYQEGLKS